MTVRMITVSAPDQTIPPIRRKAEELGASGIRTYAETQREGRTTLQMLVGSAARQDVVDAVQAALSAQKDWRLTILPVETTVPLPRDEEEAEKRRKKASENKIGGMTREEIWNIVWGQARLDDTYLMFVVLSTIVAALGMLTDSVAVVVGAMVIAPLLGPNLAFAVGVALGDGKLIGRALLTNVAGLALALLLSVAIGTFWTGSLASDELLSRSTIGFDGLVIALASGAAAALSLVTGVSSALVGVMVAVALLPPTSAIGIFLGSGQLALAGGAAMLLAVNIVSVNLAAHTILLWRGVRPRTFFEDKKAARGRLASAIVWVLLLAVLVALLWAEMHVTLPQK
ncbi:MAG: TIGR00341 family protein [Pseudomonadota bacterium]